MPEAPVGGIIQDSMDELKDAEDHIVLAKARSNPEVFGILVDRYEAAFLRKAKSILRSPEDAEEVVQDCFTRIYVYADRFRPQEGANFGSWAYAILTRLAFTRYQKLKKERGATAELEPELYESIPDKIEFLEDLSIRSEVLAALSRIPETAARILRLQFIEGKTQEEIAELEGASVSAVKTRVHRAKKQFKEALDQTTTYDH
jgi:RNA polymerase sigma factor (sigma-70 family)